MAGPLSSLAKVIFVAICGTWRLREKHEFYRRGAAVRKSIDVRNGISTFQKNTKTAAEGRRPVSKTPIIARVSAASGYPKKWPFYRRGATVRKSKDVRSGVATFRKKTENGRRGARAR